MNIIYKIKKKIKEYLNECSKIYLDIHVFNNLKKYIIIILVLYYQFGKNHDASIFDISCAF